MGNQFVTGLNAVIGLAMCAMGFGSPAAAENPQGVFASAHSRIDVIHDSRNQLVLVSQGGELLLFDDQTGELVDTLVIGGDLAGMDISADGSRLAVADYAVIDGRFRVHLVDLQTMAVQTVSTPVDSTGFGAFAVAFDREDTLYVSGSLAAVSGSRTLYRLPNDSDTFDVLADVRQNTMLRASGDRNVIAFAEAGVSPGRWGVYYPSTGALVRRSGFSQAPSWSIYEIAANHDGSQFVIPASDGAHLYDADYQPIAVLTLDGGQGPTGVVYHPVESLVFLPWVGTQEVRVFNTEALEQVAVLNVGDTFRNPGNRAFVNGRLRLSDDGSLLMATVEGGVRIMPLYAPLSAADIAVSTFTNTRVRIPLQGSIGNSGSIAYRVANAPAHGEAWIEDHAVVYVPPPGFVGEVRMSYEVVYGLASREAEVSVQVLAPLIAQDDRYVTTALRPTRMPVMDNDHGGSGGDIAIIAFTQPAFGTVTQDGDDLVYVDSSGGPRQVEFTYTIGNVGGATDQATVRILRMRR